MDRLKLLCYGLITVQSLFLVWLFLSMIVDGRFRDQESNASILIFELIMAGAMFIAAICLMKSQNNKTSSRRSINDL